MANPYVNKVVINDQIKIDLTGDTVTSETLMQGYTAHDASGAPIVGSIADAFAVIAVTYPSGSVCTCTKGTKTLTAKDTSGHFLFMIPESGTWTVSCSGKTKAVSITSYGQVFEVTIALSRYLIQNGAFVSGVSFSSVTRGAYGSMTARSGYIEHKPSSTYTWDGRAYRVDVTQYNTLSIEWQVTSVDLSYSQIAVFNSIGIDDTQEAIAANITAFANPSRTGSRITTTLSLSGLTGNKYVGDGLLGTSSSAVARIYNMWLE